MNTVATFAVLLLWTEVQVFAELESPGGPRKLTYDEIDTWKVFENFAFGMAISDSDNDTIFECLAAVRTEIDPATKTAKYLWVFPETEDKLEVTIPLYLTAEEEPGRFTFTMEDDPTPKEGRIYFTDYYYCAVVDVEYHGHLCTLWTRREVKDSVPVMCIEPFVDTCGVIVPEHSRDLCPDGEGDY